MNVVSGFSRTLRAFRRTLFEPVNNGDVGMARRGQYLRFPMQARESVGVISERVGENLEGDVAVQTRIAGAVHFVHAAGATRAENLVHAESAARRK